MPNHSIVVPRTARYSTLGQVSDQTTDVWFVVHGYGQLAPFFIKKFEAILDQNTFVVAPEALSRFYMEGFTGRVGATWMTREEKQSEITDYVNFLNMVYDQTLANIDPKKVRIHVLGFSQGTTTVCRWLMNGHAKFDRLILWAGFFGNGIEDVLSADLVANKQVQFIYGTEDEFLVKLDLEAYQKNLLTGIPNMKISNFEGGHLIPIDVLKSIK
jgi:predicted esterase